MNTLLFGLLSAALALIAALAPRDRSARAVRSEKATRPRELKHARLVYMEKLFRISRPIRLVARLDRAYRQPDASLVLVEFKTRRRRRVYPTDVIQLSAQKLAIEVQTGQVVAPHAFVTIKRPDGSAVMSPHRVNLLDAAAVVSLAHRREAILSGRAEAIYAASVRACEECAYRRHCDRLRHSDPSWRRRDSFRHQQIEKGQATLNRCRR